MFLKQRNGKAVTIRDLDSELKWYKALMGIDTIPMGEIYQIAKRSASKSDLHQRAFDLLDEIQAERFVQKVRLSLIREDVTAYKVNISRPELVYQLDFLQEKLVDCDREKFVCLHLNIKNDLVSYELVAVGSLNTSVVHPREVFKGAVLANAASVILCHNHPSGDPEPSAEDIRITKRLVEAGKILGIEVLDHVIFGNPSFVSLKERNII
jgi:DNA repair protein RadC